MGGRSSASIVVVSYNSAEYLRLCLESVLKQDYPSVEVIVVDNDSEDDSVGLVQREFPQVSLVRSENNRGFSGGANLGFHHAGGEILCVLNPDVVLSQDWLSRIVDALLADDRAGIGGGKLLYPDGKTIQHAGGVIERPLAATKHTGYGMSDDGRYDEVHECDFVTGAALAAKRVALEQIGYFDESFFPAYFEEPDLCLRAKAAGWRTIYVPDAVGIHFESATLDMRGEDYFRYHQANRLRFVAKHWTVDELFNEFLPAETARLRGTMPDADRTGSRYAYRQALETAQGRSEISMEQSQRPEYKQLDLLKQQIQIIRSGWPVKERPFRSNVPVIGRLIVFFRTRMNNFATRWYMQPILQQQNQLNQAVLRALEDVERQIENIDAPMEMHNAVVHERLKRVEDRLERIEILLNQLMEQQGSKQ